MSDAPMRWRQGGSHCGAVRFEVLAPDEVEIKDCNCSICRRSGHQHLQVEKERFRLLEGADTIATYTFNTGTAQHHFCSICGVKSFYVPRSMPHGYDVNVRCLDEPLRIIRVNPFDGDHWEQAMAEPESQDQA